MQKLLLFILIFTALVVNAQTPVPMAVQPALTYTATFDSINSWSNNFASGAGSACFASVATGGSNAIPDATKITTNSTTFITSQMSAGGLYKDTVNGRLVMLVTGTTNNTNSIAIDLFPDFTNAGAGSLSFDWETIFNGTATSNRTATLKVYASDNNGASFVELTGAQVTITNNVSGNGSVTNIALPASFSNNAATRLRFYYYNSAGGSTGSRPAIALDNITVTAAGVPCSVPVAAPSSLLFTNVTPTSLQGVFTAATPAPDEYLVVSTTNATLAHAPLDGKVYNMGDTVADGEVVYRGNGTSFTLNNLNPLTAYTFYIYSCNIYCNGIIRYLTASPLIGMQTTPAGPPCPTPTVQPTNLQFTNITTTSVSASFTPSIDATEYVVIRSTSNSLGAVPVNSMVYNAGDVIGNGTVVYSGNGTSFTTSNLIHSTMYYFFVFGAYNYACSGGPAYLTSAPLTGMQSTNILYPCAAPFEDAANLILKPDIDYITGFFDAGNPNTDGFLVVMSTTGTLTSMPQNGTAYTLNGNLGGGKIISLGKNYSFNASGLMGNTSYYFFVVPYNDICTGGPIYKTNNLLQGSATTTTISPLNYYFGNLHSHSAYSDGNQDDRSKDPTDDYDFAKNAMCMDFLGISEHNHYTANNNPGMTEAEYQPGLLAAENYTNVHPGFLALYGMEWGTLTNGGHSLVYGIDSLIGWETINGTPNYDIYVPKNDFTSSQGLFSVVNSFNAGNAFATLAHPSFNDFQNIANSFYNAAVDSALVGIALESGPAFSPDTAYMAPGGNMEFLPYYLQMLSQGYHVAPMIDHDNHNMTFGHTAQTRTVVISQSLSKADFMQAMRDMHFYATQSCDAHIAMDVYGQQMGSMMNHQFAPAINITVRDATNTTTPSIKLMYGKPGSGILPVQLATVSGNYLSYTDLNLSVNDTGYYYADVLIGNKRMISAPVWYKRDNDPVLSVKTPQVIPATYQVTLKDNPARSVLNVDVWSQQDQNIQFSVYNLTGQQLISIDKKVRNGNQSFTFILPPLPAGVYILKTISSNSSSTKKFIHQ